LCNRLFREGGGTEKGTSLISLAYVPNISDVPFSVPAIVDHLVFSVFGDLTWETPGATTPRFTNAGMQSSAAAGMDHDGARWYDAVDAVFASQDPIQFASGVTNLAGYCGKDGKGDITDIGNVGEENE
jgi:RHS repeat-associated protein